MDQFVDPASDLVSSLQDICIFDKLVWNAVCHSNDLNNWNKQFRLFLESSTSSSQVICHPLGPDSEVLYDPLTSDTDSAVSISSQFTANHAGNRPSADSSGLRCGGRSVPLGVCLTLSDHERLRIFINEFIVKGLISWAEKSIRTLNDQALSTFAFSFFFRSRIIKTYLFDLVYSTPCLLPANMTEFSGLTWH